MTTTIAVAGATGNLGRRIVSGLVERGADVRALVRPGTPSDKRKPLEQAGATVLEADLGNVAALTAALAGAACVVSALQGLRDVILGTQSVLLDAAIAAGVPRFIPSDFSIDFMKLPAGTNRNLDLRREFHQRLDTAPIAATSILNGAFAELLISRMQLLDLKASRVTHWGSEDQRLDFTTIDDTASFTAAAALDPHAPRALRIAGDSISPRELATVAGEVKHATFELVRAGSLEELAAFIARERSANPASENEPYPRWQGMQYSHNMFSGLAKLDPLDNHRYDAEGAPNIRWTTARDLIAAA